MRTFSISQARLSIMVGRVARILHDKVGDTSIAADVYVDEAAAALNVHRWEFLPSVARREALSHE